VYRNEYSTNGRLHTPVERLGGDAETEAMVLCIETRAAPRI
jgi:hypothetical protein